MQSSAVHPVSIKDLEWKEKIKNLGYNRAEMDNLLNGNFEIDLESFYHTLSRNDYLFTKRKNFPAWVLYVLSGSPSAIQFAIDKKGLKDDSVFEENNPLHYAARSGSVGAMDFILQKLKLNTNQLGLFDQNVLHIAAESGSIMAIYYAVEVLGLDIESKDDEGKNILRHAIDFTRESKTALTLKYVLYLRHLFKGDLGLDEYLAKIKAFKHPLIEQTLQMPIEAIVKEMVDFQKQAKLSLIPRKQLNLLQEPAEANQEEKGANEEKPANQNPADPNAPAPQAPATPPSTTRFTKLWLALGSLSMGAAGLVGTLIIANSWNPIGWAGVAGLALVGLFMLIKGLRNMRKQMPALMQAFNTAQIAQNAGGREALAPNNEPQPQEVSENQAQVAANPNPSSKPVAASSPVQSEEQPRVSAAAGMSCS